MNFTGMKYSTYFSLSKNKTYLRACGVCYPGELSSLSLQMLNQADESYPLYRLVSTMYETVESDNTIYLTMIFSRRENSSAKTNDWWED